MNRPPACLPVVLLGIVLVSSGMAQENGGWELAWADEFSQADGAPPDSSKWGYDIGGSGWGNNELQYYTNRTQNSRVEDGKLVIEARAEAYGGRNHTSARLLTKGRWSWTYGRIEARIKVPAGRGIWPAFWMLGANIDSTGWPACGEIDIMEHIGSEPATVHGTLHGPGYSGGGGISGDHALTGAALSDDFHVFAIEWEENRIRWFIDGQAYFTITPANLPNGSNWVFNQPQFLILNVAVGGNWPGNPDGSTVFPQRMTVDYVRVYTRAAGDNLLLNPGFESGGLANWTPFGGNTSLESDAARSGANSFKVFGQFTGADNDTGAFQEIPALPGQRYQAAAWMLTPSGDKIAGANSACAEVSFRNAQGQILALFRTEPVTAGNHGDAWGNLPVNRQLDVASGETVATVSDLVAPAGTATVRKRLVFSQVSNAGGSVRFDDLNLSQSTGTPAGTTVTVDPAGNWLGYMNVSRLPADGGAFLFGNGWNTADLRATFSGPTLTLSPNTINDAGTYWYAGGGAPGNPGNKIMGANMYVEKTGPLSGQTVTFTGRVLANSLTSAHSSVAFIKDFAADYSSSNVVTVPLVNGVFSISLATDPGAGRHVQYGFQTTGPNVWSTDVAPFGSVQITAETPDPFVNWMGKWDFTGFVSPELAAAGDPDNDGWSNLAEFAFDDDPATARASGKVRSGMVQTSGGNGLVLTLPVRDGAVFSGSPAKSAAVGKLTYVVEGSDRLEIFNREVTEVPASADGMPPLGAGWSYRSFRFGSVGGPSGFVRVRVSMDP